MMRKRRALFAVVVVALMLVTFTLSTLAYGFEPSLPPQSESTNSPSLIFYTEYRDTLDGPSKWTSLQLPTQSGVYYFDGYGDAQLEVNVDPDYTRYTLSFSRSIYVRQFGLVGRKYWQKSPPTASLYVGVSSRVRVTSSALYQYYDPYYVGDSTSLIKTDFPDFSREVSGTSSISPFPVTSSQIPSGECIIGYSRVNCLLSDTSGNPVPSGNMILTISVPTNTASELIDELTSAYQKGYSVGVNSNVDAGSLFDGIISGVTGIFDVELFGTVSLGDLLYVALAIVVVVVALKFFAGG